MVVARLSVLVCLAMVACANEGARMAGPGDGSGEAGAAGGSGGGGSRDGGAGVLAGSGGGQGVDGAAGTGTAGAAGDAGATGAGGGAGAPTGVFDESLRARAAAGMAPLQTWYDAGTGLWNTNDWWTSANQLETVIDHARETGDPTYFDDIDTTFVKNQASNFDRFGFYDDDRLVGDRLDQGVRPHAPAEV